jgi:hypothetical protein
MNATARQVFRHVFGKCWPAVILVTALSTAPAAWAAFGEVVEKPVPEFSRQGDRISARLIPRAKSTSVQIQFSAAGAKLLDVEGLDFEKAERPEVDVKNFKSGLFIIHLGGVTPGGEAKVSLTSDFFISATQFYVFNASLPQPWIIADAANLTLPDRVQELVVTVKDGGPFDSDGKTDGRITLVGGPRDSFWGYALGTLFIRFFGIFIVLSILMLGMIFSGLVFQWLARRKATGRDRASAAGTPQTKAEIKRPPVPLPDPAAAAVAIALHLHLAGAQAPQVMDLSGGGHAPGSWTLHGRAQMMAERLLVFNRKNR